VMGRLSIFHTENGIDSPITIINLFEWAHSVGIGFIWWSLTLLPGGFLHTIPYTDLLIPCLDRLLALGFHLCLNGGRSLALGVSLSKFRGGIVNWSAPITDHIVCICWANI
jgi:hypothetical protein